MSRFKEVRRLKRGEFQQRENQGKIKAVEEQREDEPGDVVSLSWTDSDQRLEPLGINEWILDSSLPDWANGSVNSDGQYGTLVQDFAHPVFYPPAQGLPSWDEQAREEDEYIAWFQAIAGVEAEEYNFPN